MWLTLFFYLISSATAEPEYKFTVDLNPGIVTTLYDYTILKHLPITYVYYPNLGHYIQCVSIENVILCGDKDNYWALYINGKYASVGVDKLSVKNGDNILLKYTRIHTEEVSSTSTSTSTSTSFLPPGTHLYLIKLSKDQTMSLYDYSILKHLPWKYTYDPTWGHFIQCVNNLCGSNQYYWAIYLNGAYAQEGVDTLIVKNGDKIELRYTKILEQFVEKKVEPKPIGKPIIEHLYLIHLGFGLSTSFYNYSILKHLPFQYKLDPKYGHFLTCIEHICGNNEYFWAIYFNGQYAQVGVDHLLVKNGDQVGIVYTKINSDTTNTHLRDL